MHKQSTAWNNNMFFLCESRRWSAHHLILVSLHKYYLMTHDLLTCCQWALLGLCFGGVPVMSALAWPTMVVLCCLFSYLIFLFFSLSYVYPWMFEAQPTSRCVHAARIVPALNALVSNPSLLLFVCDSCFRLLMMFAWQQTIISFSLSLGNGPRHDGWRQDRDVGGGLGFENCALICVPVATPNPLAPKLVSLKRQLGEKERTGASC